MLQTARSRRYVLLVAGLGSFVLFLLLFALLLGLLFMKSFLVVGLLYVCVFCPVCAGVVLTGLLVGVLVREWHEELRTVKRKETVVRSYYRYRQLRDSSSMDN